jgi:predicted HTH domain antitoxin
MAQREVATVTVNLEVPKEIERQLIQEWNGELPQKIVEAIAVLSFREGKLSRGQISEMLNLSFHETEAFLIERAAYAPCSPADIDRGRAALENLLAR